MKGKSLEVPAPLNEAERVEALHGYDILDTDSEESFDDLTLLASQICETPIACIAMLDEKRMWFKSKVGLAGDAIRRDISFCAHAISQKDLFVVEDAQTEERFASNPLVTGEPNIRFYAGFPLVVAGGLALGTLCVMDQVPHRLTETQKTGLRLLSRQVIAQLELRRSLKAKSLGESQLRASELRYRRLFEAAKDGVLILEIETGRITDVNPFLVELLKFSRSEMVGKTVGELSPFKDIWSNKLMLERLQQDGYVRYEDLPLKTRDGRQIDVEFVCNVYQAGDKKVIQCNIRDITARKASEQQLTLLSACISNLNDLILITEAAPLDEPGPKIVFVNEALERITGYKPEEALGRSPRFLQGRNTDRHVMGEISEALAKGEPIRRQFINYKKDGSECWMDVDLVPVLNAAGTCTHFAAIERDITKQKSDEEQIVEQATFLDKAQDAIFVRDLDGKMLFWNKGAERLYGWGREEVVNRNVDALIYLEPDKLREAYQRVTIQGDWSGELQHGTKDGDALIIESRWTLIRDNKGAPKSILAINTDITEKKKLEAQFLRAQRMESIGTLAGGIAHDLNNILAPILMSIEILKVEAVDAQTMRILETIEISAKRGADIVRQVLSFARGLEGQRVEIQPRHLFRDVEAIIKDTFPKDVRLHFSIPEEPWLILGDPTQVHQILLNLCVNARDAMPGGGSLDLRLENIVLDEHYVAMHSEAKAGRYVLFSVSDSGTGIPLNVIDRIYEPFFTTKNLNKGTGLGLSTVMAIVKSHDGIINVYSELGKGTIFKVYLPAMEASDEAGREQAFQASLPRGNGETILVVDDEETILAITRQTLRAFGYQVLTAENGAEAIAAYAEHRQEIAVVLTDMMMPVMEGTAMIYALTKMNPAIKIIAASGLNPDGSLPRTVAKHFLAKPYTAGTLLKAVRAILDEG